MVDLVKLQEAIKLIQDALDEAVVKGGVDAATAKAFHALSEEQYQFTGWRNDYIVKRSNEGASAKEIAAEIDINPDRIGLIVYNGKNGKRSTPTARSFNPNGRVRVVQPMQEVPKVRTQPKSVWDV